MRKLLVALCLCLAPGSSWAAGDVSDNVVGDMVAPTNGGAVSGVVLAPDGTAPAPAYSFSSDADTGMYRISSNALGFASGGAENLRLDGTNVIVATGIGFRTPTFALLTSGSAASPAMAFAGTGQGFYKVSTNGLGLATNGLAALEFDTNQKANFYGSQLQLTRTDGAATSLTTGIILGAATSTGASLVWSTNGTLRVMTGNQAANGTMEAATYNSTTDSGTLASNYSAVGVSNGAGARIALNGGSTASFIELNSQRHIQSTKTADYTVTFTDTGRQFNNTAAGSMVTYTLPAATAGVFYDFQNTAAGAGFTKLLAVGTDKIAHNGVLGASAGNLLSTAIWTTVRLVCHVTGTWQVEYYTGTWTLT